MKKKTIVISGIILAVLLIGGLVVAALGNGSKDTIVDNKDTELVENTEIIESTEELVANVDLEMDTLEGAVTEEESTQVEEEKDAVVEDKTEVEKEEVKTEVESTVTEPEKQESTDKQESAPVKQEEISKQESTSDKKEETPKQESSTDKEVVVNSNDGADAKPERVEAKEYDSRELTAINAGYWNVAYDPETGFYVVLTPDGSIETDFKAEEAIQAYLNSIGLEGSGIRGCVINSAANQYLTYCTEVREKTTAYDEPSAEEVLSDREYEALFMTKEEFEAKYGEGTFPY